MNQNNITTERTDQVVEIICKRVSSWVERAASHTEMSHSHYSEVLANVLVIHDQDDSQILLATDLIPNRGIQDIPLQESQ